MIKANDINKTGKLQHMVAEDMFIDKAKQVFNAKTGKWIGTITPGNELNFEPEIEPEDPQEPETKNPDQLSLFN